jgi:hypothetical protein
MTIYERAHRLCARHNAECPNMPNIPIQTVFEYLLEIQHAALKDAGISVPSPIIYDGTYDVDDEA